MRRHFCEPQTQHHDCLFRSLLTCFQRLGWPRFKWRTYVQLAGDERQATRLWGATRALRKIGAHLSPMYCPNYESLLDAKFPLVAHIRTETGLPHFVAVHQVDRRGVLVADPMWGLEYWPRDFWEERWTKKLLLLDRHEHADSPRETPPYQRMLQSWRAAAQECWLRGFVFSAVMTAMVVGPLVVLRSWGNQQDAFWTAALMLPSLCFVLRTFGEPLLYQKLQQTLRCKTASFLAEWQVEKSANDERIISC